MPNESNLCASLVIKAITAELTDAARMALCRELSDVANSADVTPHQKHVYYAFGEQSPEDAVTAGA